MNQRERDNEQLGMIMRLCNRLDTTVSTFGNDFDTFYQNTVYQDACSMCLVQIGEAVHRLSDDFKISNAQIEWHRIYGMRNHLVHGYAMFDAEIAWQAIQEEIPPLRAFCEERFID